jgi:truncated hemoglobin YjbI
MSFTKLSLAAVAALSLTACDAFNAFQGGRLDPGATQNPGAPVGGGGAPGPAPAGGQTLFAKLGGEPAIRTVVTDFVGRVVKDPKINGYFLNSRVSGQRVIDCLVLQVGTLTGGPGYTYPSGGCRDMKTVHTKMGVSKQDFDDTAAHLIAALQAARVPQADIDTIVGAVAGTAPDIIEDMGNNQTVYQRVGRKPAIDQVVGLFIDYVAKDARINGFFGSTDVNRLRTCLTRQVCSIDGPCKYGEEVDGAEPGVGSGANVCKGMVAIHDPINKSNKPITIADFNVLVGDLIVILDAAKVPEADKNGILGALGPLCKQIVANGTGCP